MISVYYFADQNGTPFYVGLTNNFKRRFNEHNLIYKKGKNGNTWPVYKKISQLQTLFNYSLNMVLICECESYQNALLIERGYIKQYRAEGYKLYNITDGGDGTHGHKPIFTEEWKDKLKLAKSNNKWSGINNPFFGKHHSLKTRLTFSSQRKGKNTKEENPFYGKHHSKETKQIISQKNSGSKNVRTLHYKIIDPFGKIYYSTEGLNVFCKQINATNIYSDTIHASGLNHTLKGRQNHHKGWKIQYV